MDPTPRVQGAPDASRARPPVRMFPRRWARFDGGAKDARIEMTALLLWAALQSAPMTTFCVRDDATALPDSVASVEESDTSLHAASRTLPLPSPVVVLPMVRVDAALERARRRAPTAFVTTLSARRDTRAMSALHEALVEAAGVRVTQYGGMGAFSTMSLRGAPPGHVTVMLDGVPLTSAASGVVDLADVPAAAVEAIELYRGASPVAWGSPTPGGLVNLVTLADADARTLRMAAGSWGTGEVAGDLGGRRGAWSLLAHGGWQGSDGDFRYRDDNGTPLDAADDTIARRANARFDAATALARVGWAPNGPVQGSLHAEWFRRGQGVPGAGAVPARNARFASDRATLAGELRAGRRGASAAWTLRANESHRRARLRDTLGELGFGRVDTDERFRDRGASLEWRARSLWSGFEPAMGAALRAEHADPAAPTAGLPDPPASRRDTRAAWLTLDQHLAGDRVLLHAARRWDEQRESVSDTRSTGSVRTRAAARTLDAPQLGARWAITDALAFRANWNRAGRAPDLDELFGLDGAVTGNPDLRPESSESWDAGLSWTARTAGIAWTAEWATHATHARDLILFERSSPRGAKPVNVSAARLRGEEASLRAAWRTFELSASTAWLSAIDRSTIAFYRGRRLPQRAERQSFARLAWHAGRWSAASEVEYLGDTFLDRANFRRAPSRTLVAMSVGARVGAALVLLEGRNLGDRLAEDVAGFPLPGRTLRAAVTLDLAARETTP